MIAPDRTPEQNVADFISFINTQLEGNIEVLDENGNRVGDNESEVFHVDWNVKTIGIRVNGVIFRIDVSGGKAG